MNKRNIKLLTGAEAAVEALRQINPEVMAAYPITPQTPIIEGYAKLVAARKVSTEYLRVESEHSALAACIGAAASGARSVTATASQGLAYMNELLGVASGMRLAIMMNVVTRALSAPINIHGDHSDIMATRDLGWIQLFSENATEVYENNLLGLRLAERARLPVMVAQDGFITSHALVNSKILPDEIAREFVGDYHPDSTLLDWQKPHSFGAGELPGTFFETALERERALNDVNKYFNEIGKELAHYTQANIEAVEWTGDPNAPTVIVSLGAVAGLVKEFIENNQTDNQIAAVKIRQYRPFPDRQLRQSLGKAKTVVTIDRCISYGARPPLLSDICSALNPTPIEIWSYVAGLGGREMKMEHLEHIARDLKMGAQSFNYFQ